MSLNQYKGMRYTPLIWADESGSHEWTQSIANSTEFEHLTVVTYQGSSYTSRKIVPPGIGITNNAYWVRTGDYNAQVAIYREEVSNFSGNIIPTTNEVNNAKNGMTTLKARIDNLGIVPVRIEGETNDKLAIERALAQSSKIVINDNLVIDGKIEIPSDTVIDGKGSITSTNSNEDIFLISSNNANNIKISNIKLDGGRYGVQIYGVDSTIKPHDISLNNIKTVNCLFGGIFVNVAHDVKISGCVNDGGYRHIGVIAPITAPDSTYNVSIKNCMSNNTTHYVYQAYYGKNIKIISNSGDGSLLASEDKTVITVDRTKNCIVNANVCTNGGISNIFVTGADGCTITDNHCSGGDYGIQVCYNIENEDLAIKESKNTTIANNVCVNQNIHGIIVNSCINVNIANNLINNPTQYAIYLMQSVRSYDSTQ